MTSQIKLWAKQLRLHQWAKNLLLLVPAFASFKLFRASADTLSALVLAFLAFGLVASSIYIFNDFLDLASDRHHATKRNRPMASGAISATLGLVVAGLLLVLGLVTGFAVGWNFFLALLVYLALTVAYSIWLKKWVLVDAIVLAGLYTLRVVAGGVATSIELSFWLLAFSVFFFIVLHVIYPP